MKGACAYKETRLLICAEDGYVDEWLSKDDCSKWSYAAFEKYKRCKVFCLLPDASVKEITLSHHFSSFLDKFLSMLFNKKLDVDLDFKEENNLDLNFFVNLIIKLVSEGDELLIQNSESDVIVHDLRCASSYTNIRKIYHKYNWV